MYDIRHRLIWAISGFVSAVSLLVLTALAGYGFFQALLLSALILALVALVLWILWVSEPESLVDILAPPRPELPRPSPEPRLPDAPMVRDAAGEAPPQPLRQSEVELDEGNDDDLLLAPSPEAGDEPSVAAEATPIPAAPGLRAALPRPKAGSRGGRRTLPRRTKADKPGQTLADLPEEAEVVEADDLLQINGIDHRAGAVLERLGLTRFAQIAALSGDDIRRIETELSAPGRVEAEGWIDQAKALGSKEGQP